MVSLTVSFDKETVNETMHFMQSKEHSRLENFS